MATAGSKAVIQRFYEEFHNAGRSDRPHPDILDEIMDPDFVLDNPPAHGRGQFKARVAELYAKHPDMKVGYGPMVAEGDRVAVRWTVTGKDIDLNGITISRLTHDKIVEGLSNYNSRI